MDCSIHRKAQVDSEYEKLKKLIKTLDGKKLEITIDDEMIWRITKDGYTYVRSDCSWLIAQSEFLDEFCEYFAEVMVCREVYRDGLRIPTKE